MKKLILGLVAATAVAAAVPGLASADVTNNGTTDDAWGYGVANHIHNFNGDHNGIGWTRSVSQGDIAEIAGTNRAPDITRTSQGNVNDQFAPISNNG